MIFRLKELLITKLSREEINTRAHHWYYTYIYETHLGEYDKQIENYLEMMLAIDLKSAPNVYVLDLADVQTWLIDIEQMKMLFVDYL